MVESEDEVVKITKRKHKIYCDECGELLDESIEDYDGFYANPFEQEITIFLSKYSNCSAGTRYTMTKDLCPSCYDKVVNSIINVLTPIGFKKD